MITPSLLADALTYEQYMVLSHELFEQQRTTSDDAHYNTARILAFTKLNFARIRRLEKTVELTTDVKEALALVREPWVWLILTESWCGDAAQIVPVLHKMAEHSSRIEVRMLLRDMNLPVIDAHLTNGGRSIPKLICLRKSDLHELGDWGPRPAALQQARAGWVAEQLPTDQILEHLHLWYANDHTAHTQSELAGKIRAWSN
jgi:Thioredoxin